MEKILRFSEKKINSVSLNFKRYLYDKIKNLNEVLIWVSWLRWIWKTTMLLQIAKELKNDWKKVLYFSCDSMFVKWKTIFEIFEEFYEQKDIKYFFIDEIHKYKDWEQDLKTIYDFFDDVKIYYSWSSSIDLIRWNYDLSRRSLLYKLHKFSFREFLKFKYNIILDKLNIEDIIENHLKISYEIFLKENNILKYFKEYNQIWELWFFANSDDDEYFLKIENVINKLIYEDISNYYNIQTENIVLFFKILKFIANSWPSNLNYSSIAKQIETTSDTVKYYIEILKEIWILNIIWKEWKISVNLRKSKKALFEVNNIMIQFLDMINTDFSVWLLRESFVVSELKKVWEVYYSEKWDYLFIYKNKRYILEIWGKNKTYKQLKWVENGLLIKDEISISENKNEIPMWMLGLMY